MRRVYYRQIQVEQVVGHGLETDGRAVNIEIFVSSPYDRLVYTNTRFWNASGLDFSISTVGVTVDTQSLLSVLIGGISFDTPDTIDGERKAAAASEVLPLYQSREEPHEKTYAHKGRYLLYSKGSANGLAVGAAVRLRGIAVGRVLDVEPERIGISGDPGRIEQAAMGERLVANGLRGQLKCCRPCRRSWRP